MSPPRRRGRITIATFPPILFDRHNGILPAVVFDVPDGRSEGDTGFFDAYVTHDGGKHWSSTTPVPISRLARYPEIPYSFPDTHHGFFLIGKRLFRTRDGERHWQAILVRIPLGHVETIQFLDGHHGFALRAGDTQGDHSILLVTADGGETWDTIHARIETHRASFPGIDSLPPKSVACEPARDNAFRRVSTLAAIAPYRRLGF